MPETTKYFSSFRAQILSTENEDNMELKKTTACFTKNDRSFYQKRRVVLHKTTCRFFATLSSPLASLGKDTKRGRNKMQKHCSFLPFLQNTPFKVREQTTKNCVFHPKKGAKKGAFFLFLWFFAPTSKKNNRIISQTLGFYLPLGWKYTTVTHKALAIPALLAFFPTTLVYRNTIP